MISFELLDPEIAAAARARGLPATDGPNPLAKFRRVSSRAVYVELGEMPATPLGDGARGWVGALTLERVLFADLVRVVASRDAAEVLVEGAGAAVRLSIDGALARLLEDPEPGRRRVVAKALERGADGARGAVRILAERRVEAARQLGIDLDLLEIPVDDEATPNESGLTAVHEATPGLAGVRKATPGAAISSVAEKFLEVTEPFVPTLESWSDGIDSLIGRDAGEGWPSHLTARFLLSVFARSELFDGLRLAPVVLPRPLGATSFARGFAVLGGAYADAIMPAGAPFCLARAPFDVHRARRVALFGGLAADSSFFTLELDVGKERARDQARKVAGALALSLRLDAARVLLRGALERVPAAAAQRFEEMTELALGAGISGLLTGVVPRLLPGDAVRFAGNLLGPLDRRRLVERSDEDWFRSPHAARLLREEDEGKTPALRVSAAELGRGIAEIERTLEDLA